MISYRMKTFILKLGIDDWGTILGITAAILLSANIGISPYAFALFAVSSILWFIYAYKIREYPLMWMNVAYFVIDSFAIYRWFF
jgi:uncharacterized protein with PQ loop repeat